MPGFNFYEISCIPLAVCAENILNWSWGYFLEELESEPNRSTSLQYSHSLAQITSCSDHLPSSKHLLRQGSEDMSFAMAT